MSALLQSCRLTLIKEKDLAVKEAEEHGLKYLRTPGEYGFMTESFSDAMGVYVQAKLRSQPELTEKVCLSLGSVWSSGSQHGLTL